MSKLDPGSTGGKSNVGIIGVTQLGETYHIQYTSKGKFITVPKKS